MNATQSTREPISKIANQLSKLKKQLKSIKSMKTLSLIHVHPSWTKKVQAKNNDHSQKFKKSCLNKSKSTLLLDGQHEKQRHKIQTRRRIAGKTIDMSVCKQIKRSVSSQSKSKSKSNKKNRSLQNDIQNGSLTERIDSLKGQNPFDKSNIQQTEPKQQRLGPNNKQNKLIAKLSSFDNVFAQTKSIPRQTMNENQNQQSEEQNESHQQKKTHKNEGRVYEKTKSRQGHQHSYGLKDQVSFGQQSNFRRNLSRGEECSHKITSQLNDYKISFKELNNRVKARANYEPNFNQINFLFSSFIDSTQSSQSSPNQSIVVLGGKKKGIEVTYNMKSEMLMNKLKKSLLRYPNYSAILQDTISKEQIPIDYQRTFSHMTEKSIYALEQRYTQYLQQVQCDINQVINLFNQYQNESFHQLNMKKSQLNVSHLPNNSINFKREPFNDKENMVNLINFQHQQAGKTTMLKENSTKDEDQRKEIKHLKKHIKKLERQLTEKDEQFLEMQFKYVLKCEQEQNLLKYTPDLIVDGQNNTYGPEQSRYKQNTKLDSHIQILQEETTQLYEKVELIKVQLTNKQQQIQQLSQSLQKETKNVQTLLKQLQKSSKNHEIHQQDLNLVMIQNQALKEQIRVVETQKEKQREKHKRRIFELENQKQQVKKELAGIKKVLLGDQKKIKNLQIDLSKERQHSSDMQQSLKIQVKDLQRNTQKYQLNQVILNKKVEQLTKQFFILQNKSSQQTSVHEKLKQQSQKLTEDLTSYRQRLLSLEKTQKQNEVLRNQNQKLSMSLQQLQKELSVANENVEILKGELEVEYNTVKQLEEAIQRYKDRCIKAQIQLREDRYLMEGKMTGKKQIESEDVQQIKKIIQEHKHKLNIEV